MPLLVAINGICLIALGNIIFVSSNFFTVSYCIFYADFRSVIGFSLSSLFTEILRLIKIAYNFQTSDDRENPITYLKSGGKSLLETINNMRNKKKLNICYPVTG